MEDKLQKLIKESYDIKNQIESLEAKLSGNKLKLQNYFDKKKLSEYVADDIKVKKIDRLHIEYFVDKLEEKFTALSKSKSELLDKIIDKNYYITNFEGLVDLLKKYKVKPSEFKKFIRAQKIANKNAIKQLFDIGEITMEDLSGCFEAKIVKSIQFIEKGDKD